MRSDSLIVSTILSCLVLTAAHGEEPASGVRAAIVKADPTLQVGEVDGSPAQGLYRASLGGVDGYVTADGRYFIVGDMFEVASRENLSERRRVQMRRDALAGIEPDEMIVFAPPKPRHVVTVFTDVDCGYCRKLHQNIAAYNDFGIAVRYLAYPRTGPGSESWKKMEAVWCSTDRRDALTRAKRDEPIGQAPDCSTSAVAADYALGQKMHLQGTPLIVLDDGSAIGGYVTPAELLQRLERASVTKASSGASRIRAQR